MLIFRWAAASNDISLNAIILPIALYFWQVPHFMALAYLCHDDYAARGYVLISLFIVTIFFHTTILVLYNIIFVLSGGYSYCLSSQCLPKVLVHINKELNNSDAMSDSGYQYNIFFSEIMGTQL